MQILRTFRAGPMQVRADPRRLATPPPPGSAPPPVRLPGVCCRVASCRIISPPPPHGPPLPPRGALRQAPRRASGCVTASITGRSCTRGGGSHPDFAPDQRGLDTPRRRASGPLRAEPSRHIPDPTGSEGLTRPFAPVWGGSRVRFGSQRGPRDALSSPPGNLRVQHPRASARAALTQSGPERNLGVPEWRRTFREGRNRCGRRRFPSAGPAPRRTVAGVSRTRREGLPAPRNPPRPARRET